MIIDSEEYITTPISKYLEDMINIVGYQSIPLHLRMILTYILSNTFLLMVGALEKKLEMISWHIAHDDYEYRYDYMHNQNPITANMKRTNDLYNYLRGESSSKKSLMLENIYTNNACDTIINLFDNTTLIKYTNSEYVEFKDKCKNLTKSKDLENLYKDALDFRHGIAHNINSVYKNHPTLPELLENDMAYNWYLKFMILLTVDNALIENFEQYNKNLNKIKWS